MKQLKKVLVGGLIAVAVIAGFATWRLVTFEDRALVPLEPGPPQPRVSAAEAGLDMGAIESAVEYAGQRNSTALVIAQGGHIVFEKYWDGANADSAVRFDELTPVIPALLLGIALNDRLIPELDTPLSRLLDSTDEADASRTPRSLLTARDAETMALLLEHKTKQPWPALVTEKLWKPLGGGSLSFALRKDGPRKGLASASCCIEARIADWMRVAQLLARDGVFEANQYTPPGFVSSNYFMRVDGQFATQGVAWVGGEDHQRLWVVPSLDLTILRLGENAGAAGWDESMIPDSIIRGSRHWRPSGSGDRNDPGTYAPH